MKRDAAADPAQSKIAFVGQHHLTLTFNAPVTLHLSNVQGPPLGTGVTSFDAGVIATAGSTANVGQKRPHEDSVDVDTVDVQDPDRDGGPEDADSDSESGDDSDDNDEDGARPAHVREPVSKTAHPLEAKRRKYTTEEKARILAIYERNKNNLSATVRDVQKEASGFKDLTRQTVARWVQAPLEPKKKGRKVEEDFEKDVLGNLMFFALRDVDADTQKLIVVANAAYSYDSIRNAALLAQRSANWQTHSVVSTLKFSQGWVHAFLQRNKLHRRRVTTADKNVPPAAEVVARMQSIQKTITDNGYEPGDVINADETGIFFGATPKNQYVPKDAERASAPDSNDKARFTAVMWGSADGTMGPPFVIIKNAVTGFIDQSGSTSLDGKHLMKQEGFRADDGWEHRMWTKEMELTVKGKVYKGLFQRKYIVHKVTGAVITANKTAWMDSVTMVMWVELQLGPWCAASGRPKLLVMDSCGPHGVAVVRDTFNAQGIKVEHLPPNLTGELQVMDLVVNGPLKAAIRRERCLALHTNFLAWKADWKTELTKPPSDRVMKLFNPPTVTLADGLRTLFATCAKDFRTDAFKNGLQRAFVNVGLAHDTSMTPPFFHKYQAHGRKGTIPHVLASADATDDAIIFGDIAAEVQMEARPYDVPNEDDLDDLDDLDDDDSDGEVAPVRAKSPLRRSVGDDGDTVTVDGSVIPLSLVASKLAVAPRPGPSLPTRTSGRVSVPTKKYAWE